jgi:hypothetical protein
MKKIIIDFKSQTIFYKNPTMPCPNIQRINNDEIVTISTQRTLVPAN